MKKILLPLLLCLTLVFGARACDICGCGVGSYYIGLLPEFSQRFAGLRYQHKSLQSHLGANGERSYLTSDETYRTAELWGGWNIGKRFRVLGFVPVNFNEHVNQGISDRQSGLGDIAMIGYYKLLDIRDNVLDNRLLVQSLWLGGGLKLPTGKYEPAVQEVNGESPNIFQLGTGSTDFMLSAMYDVRLMDFGVNTNITYKLNTENSYGYRYGNKLTANLQAYYKIKLASALTVAPNAGLLYETARQDTEDGKYKVDMSGGDITMGSVGLEATLKRLSVGLSFQQPLEQDLANGSVQAGNRLVVHTTFMF